MSDAALHAPPVNAVGFTSQVTAAFRAVELKYSDSPIITDPLASHLSKAAWETALQDWQQLAALQGPGKSLRVPARNRLMDDLLLQTVQQLAVAGHKVVQIVNIGCGMDSKPWRLQVPISISWFDVDQPGVMQCKQQLLAQAGAAMPPLQQPHTPHSPAGLSNTASAGCPAPGTQEASAAYPQADASAVQFPLTVDSWHPVAVDLSETSLASCLCASGFKCGRPTVWLAEALLYYLPLDQALQLLADMRALSAPDSKLVATCIDKELHIADHERMDKGHYFHAMWHFSIDDLLEQQGLQGAGWALDMQPCTTAELAQERYGRATYVPVYGGAECVFSAVLHT